MAHAYHHHNNRIYDDKVREFIGEHGIENLQKQLVNRRDGKVQLQKPEIGVNMLLSYGNSLVQEQENVKRVQLANAYLSGAELAGVGGSSLPEGYSKQ